MINERDILLRPTIMQDLDTLFNFQLDNEANFLAAFTSKDPTNKTAYIDKYTKLLTDPNINNQTILLNDKIVGSIAKFIMFGENELTYWIDKQYWGKGIATITLKKFLIIENSRPIFGRTAFDNFGSQKVLIKCGFVKVGADKGFANARHKEIDEYIFKLI